MRTKTNISPPKWADRFLEFYCREEFLEEIQGDAHELFKVRLYEKSHLRAALLFVWDVFRFFRLSNIKKTKRLNSNILSMTRNNFKLAARLLWKQKTNTALNVSSIAVGLACFLMISLYIKQEISFDKAHENGDNIYRVWAKEDYGEGQVFFYTNSSLALAPALDANIPDVEATVQYDFARFPVGEGEGRLNERIAIASPNFFDVFTVPIVKGNSTSPLADRNAVVLSESYANKYFGDSEAVGQQMTMQIGAENINYTVSGIFEDRPLNSGFQFNMMVSNEAKERFYSAGALNSWFNIAPETYVLLKDGTDATIAEAKLPEMINTILAGEVEEGQFVLGLQPLTEIHLDTDFPVGIQPVGNPRYVYVLGAIGILVLIIACINYTTLSTGQSIRRAKEVGIRKVVGAHKGGLVRQFLSESMLIALLATGLGLLIAYLLMPLFNNLANTQLEIPFNLSGILAYVALALVLGMVTGIYPAFVLSKLKLMSVLRSSKLGGVGGNWFRKSLVVFQLLLTVFLISGTLIMRKQMDFMQNTNMGFERDAMVAVNLYGSADAQGTVARIMSAFDEAQILRSELESNPSITNLGAGNHVLGNSGWTQVGFEDKQGQFKQFNVLFTDPHFLSSFDINVTEGRDFDPNLEIDKRESVILNQAAVDYLGIENPIGKKLPGNDFGNHTIVGVTDNFNFESLRNEVGTLVIVQNPGMILQGISDISINSNPIPKLVFKYNGESLLAVRDILEDAWANTFPEQELQFNFIDERLRLMYQEEARVNKIVGIATVISILIASFGLLGLTILVVNTKVKEIGIRKVLGASPKKIFGMLFKGFSIQLLVAVLLSVPITYFFMSDWLNDFAYKVNIGVTEFGLSGLLALVIMLVVISYHAIRAAHSNPVKALRVE